MNIDFHYGVVYVVARLAGLEVADATTIAHSCQYIDDATTDGRLDFSTGESFRRFATAHVMIDYHTLNRADDSEVWVPFHFFPGGLGDTLEERAICRPNSVPAQEMVRGALAAKGRPNGLHRLGVALHTYVDTWAHQGFAGVPSPVNSVSALQSDDSKGEDFVSTIKGYFSHLGTEVVDKLFDSTKAWRGGALVGHGAALTFPDLPFAKWSYTDGAGKHVVRDNLPDFLAAADHVYAVLSAWKQGNTTFEQLALPADARAALAKLLQGNRSNDADERLTLIRAALERGDVPPLKETIPIYIPKGDGSWKQKATGIVAADDNYGAADAPPFAESFETSDYRYFHDAVKEARLFITEEILPRHRVRLV